MDVTISVRGEHTVEFAPERGTANAVVAFDGHDPHDVLERTTASLAHLRHGLSELHDPHKGPVVTVTVDHVHTHAHRPSTERGEQLPLVHTARAAVTATFIDAATLGRWVVTALQTDGVTLEGVEWDLTQATRQHVERDTRREAVRKGQRIAQDYADALGLGQVHVREIDDRAHHGVPRGRALSAAASGDGGSLFAPEQVQVTSTVDVVFAVGRP